MNIHSTYCLQAGWNKCFVSCAINVYTHSNSILIFTIDSFFFHESIGYSIGFTGSVSNLMYYQNVLNGILYQSD